MSTRPNLIVVAIAVALVAAAQSRASENCPPGSEQAPLQKSKKVEPVLKVTSKVAEQEQARLEAKEARRILPFDPLIQRGQETVRYSKNEVCVIPKNYPGAGGKDGQGPSKKEKKLCGIDFYHDPNYAICAKSFSTNPAVEVYDISELVKNGTYTKAKFEAEACLKPKSKRPGKKIAKLKSSLTCSYTPSILGYPQVSKALGGIANIPPAVIRTIHLDTHKRITAQGERGRIKKSWAEFPVAYADPKSHPELFTVDPTHVYGALIPNARGEDSYEGFSGPKHSYEEGLWAFTQTDAYRGLASEGPVSKAVPKTLEGAAQSIQTQKDATDMLVIDFIMNQQDRFGLNGNFKRIKAYKYVENGEVVSVDEKDADPAEMKSKGAVLVHELLLIDNDCGVAKSNIVKRAGTLNTVRHIDPKTYRKLLKFAEDIQRPEVQDYFKKELLFREADLNGPSGIANNAKLAASILKENCKAGKLHLDLSLEMHLGLKKSEKPGCEP